MKTLVMLSVVCLLLLLKTSSTAPEDEAQERSSDQCGDSDRRSSEVQTKSEKKLFRDIPKVPASFLSHSFIYKCRK